MLVIVYSKVGGESTRDGFRAPVCVLIFFVTIVPLIFRALTSRDCVNLVLRKIHLVML